MKSGLGGAVYGRYGAGHVIFALIGIGIAFATWQASENSKLTYYAVDAAITEIGPVGVDRRRTHRGTVETEYEFEGSTYRRTLIVTAAMHHTITERRVDSLTLFVTKENPGFPVLRPQQSGQQWWTGFVIATLMIGLAIAGPWLGSPTRKSDPTASAASVE